MRKAGVSLFIREKVKQTGAKIKEEPNKWLSSYTGASILGKH